MHHNYFLAIAAIYYNTSGTGGKFTTGVVDTGAVVHLGLRISREFSKKFEMTRISFSGAWGKMIHGKDLKQKNLVTLSL